MTAVQSTIPPVHQGAFDVSELTATAASYPTDGLGSHGVVASATPHWTTLGLTAGTFEVVVDSILVYTPGGVNLVSITAEEGSHVFVAATSVTGLSISMKGGFSVVGSGTGFCVTYRIQKYQS